MASKGGQPKKAQRIKAKSRPIGTTALSEPLIAEASAAASFSAFSPSGLLFAHIALAVDKHRLRIFDTESGKAVAETVFQNARVSAVHWTELSNAITDTHDPTEAEATDGDDGTSRKRKKRKSVSGKDVVTTEQVLVVGFSNGSLAIFSPRQGEVVRTLSSPTITTPILSITSSSQPGAVSSLVLWTSSANGHVCSWDITNGRILSTLRTSKNTASNYTAIAINPTAQGHSRLLAARHRIQLFGVLQNADSTATSSSSREYASFTGHASPIFALEWTPSSSLTSSSAHTFLSAAEGDRFACIWQLPEIEDDEDYDSDEDESAPEGTLLASIPLDTDIRSVGYAPSFPSTSQSFAYALSASGALRIFSTPSESPAPAKGKRTEPITSVDGTNVTTAPTAPPIVSVSFDAQRPGSVRVARLVTGIKPVFDRLEFLDKDGSFVRDVKLKAPSSDVKDDSTADKVLATKRYKEGNTTSIRSGAELVAATGTDATQDGTLDTSLAELSLGQRLVSSRPGGAGNNIDHARPGQPGSDAQSHFVLKADAPTLTRTLTQALHSNDTPLLESVLANSSRALISGTVQRLQPQYALPLIMACVERMNRGARAGRGKGRGGGASAQRAELMVRWIRAVLVAHTAHLMTVPDLVSRLSALHTTVVQRTSLQDRLLSLNGRLDLVLAQIEFRATLPAPTTPAPATSAPQTSAARRRKAKKERKRAEGIKYVEGESSDEDENAGDQNAMQVDNEDDDEDDDTGDEEDDGADIEESDDDGSVEDIELGAEESDIGSESGDDDEDDDEDGSGPRLNGFLDVEAEESSGDGESGTDESDE